MYPQPVQPVPVVMAPVPQAVPVQYNAAPQPVVIQAPQNDTKTKVIITVAIKSIDTTIFKIKLRVSNNNLL